MREAIARAVLGVCEGQLARAIDHTGVDFTLLRCTGSTINQATSQYRGQDRLDQQGLADRLHGAHQINRTTADATGCFGEGNREDAHFGELLPDCVACARLGLDHFLAILESIGVVQETTDGFGEQPLFFIEIEIHGHRPSVALAMMLR